LDNQTLIGVVLGLGTAFIWATTSLAIKAQSDRINTSSFNAFRMFVAMVFAFALLPFFGGVEAILQMPINATLMLAISSVIGIALGDTLYFWSMTKIGAARALPISGTYPLFTWTLAVPILGEEITLNAIFGTVLVLVGVYFLAPQTEKTLHTDARTERWGMIAVVAAAALWAVATMMLKLGVDQAPHVIVVNAIRLPVAAFASVLVTHWQSGTLAWRGYNRKSLPMLIALSIYSTGIGMIVWTLAVDFAGAARASLINTAAPIIGVPLSAIFLKEQVTRKIVAGTLLTMIGIWSIL
jgi:DME family drug/metabolite transporter